MNYLLRILCIIAGVVRHGMAERVYRLEFVSNHGFTDSEFDKWRETMMLSGLSLPSVYDIEKKVASIEFAMNYSFKDSDIDAVTGYGYG